VEGRAVLFSVAVSRPVSAIRLDLAAVEAALRAVEREFPAINAGLKSHRDPMDDEIVAKMMAGYTYVDAALAAGTDVLAMGSSRWLLELNALVLCGADPRERSLATAHLCATEERFYDDSLGGIRGIVEWYALHKNESVWKRAAGVYVRMLSEPQLFIEGNHRTGALLMSYILAREGNPPFVLTVENAKAYFDPSTLIRKTKRTPFALLYRLPKIKREFAAFLKSQSDERFLLKHPVVGPGS
jgi:hypothetical protein